MKVSDLNEVQHAALVEMVTECMIAGGFFAVSHTSELLTVDRSGSAADVMRRVLKEFPVDFVKHKPSAMDDFLKTLQVEPLTEEQQRWQKYHEG